MKIFFNFFEEVFVRIYKVYRIESQWGQTALYGASKNGHLGVVEKLLAQPGIDINAGGATPLYIAAEQVGIVLQS